MSLLCDYFLANSDEQAVATLDWVGGPAHPPPPGWLRRQRVAALPTVSLPGIEPIVKMSRLQHLLAGRSVEELVVENAQDIGCRDGGERIVVRLSESFQRTLAETSTADLRQVARPWSETEEFWGQADPEAIEGVLVDLAGLARRGVELGLRLYCWVCV